MKNFQVGDRVGVRCFVDSCRTCKACREGQEQYCELGMLMTYGGRDKSGGITQGGYSTQIVVDENYVLKIPHALSSAGAAPLLCAGITTYSPLNHWGIGKDHRLGVVRLGGLGHMAVKMAKALGAEVTVLSSSEHKRDDAFKLGATNFALTSNPQTFTNERILKGDVRFQFVIDVASLRWNEVTCVLRRDSSAKRQMDP